MKKNKAGSSNSRLKNLKDLETTTPNFQFNSFRNRKIENFRNERRNEEEEEGKREDVEIISRAIALIDNIPSLNHQHRRQSLTAAPSLSNLLHDQWKDSIYFWLMQIYPTCICSVVCPCVLAGYVAETIHWKKSFAIIFYFLMGISIICFFMYFLRSLGLLVFIFLILYTIAFQLRSNLRRLLRLPGGPLSDCLFSCCCPCCVIAQV